MLKFSNKFSNSRDAVVFFAGEGFSFKSKEGLFAENEENRARLFVKGFQNLNQKEKILSFDINEKLKCFVVKISKKVSNFDAEELGANFCLNIKNSKQVKTIDFYPDSLNAEKNKLINYSLSFVHGFNLKSYDFNKYKTQNLEKEKSFSKNLHLVSSFSNEIEKKYKDLKAVEDGVFLTRDLVSEPPNTLNPEHYVKEILKLKQLGLKVNVLDEKKMKNLGLNALLGVGQGSVNKSYLVSIEWNGSKNKKDKPIALVGKGVCFDTGGISLKPARFMEEMKYDMAGSAVVVGLLKTLAMRKAKANVVGVVGLVENMPGGNAQRPGDIVKSFSGKTIEILNTDAEGRLVLADALSYTENNFKPKFIIDLATLTGAIIVCLGEEYAGLFSNNDELSDKVFKSGMEVNEKVWRFPLHKNYDKLIDSTVADVQNINYSGGAGSITAAQFLQRFILNNTPWAHLDIAGMAFSKKAANLNPRGATGFGVRLLNNLIKKYYE